MLVDSFLTWAHVSISMTYNIIKLIFGIKIIFYLSVCEVVMAEVLPQQPVLSQ